MKLLALLPLVSFLGLCGCGGSAPAPTVAIPLSVTGNWEITGTPATGSTALPAPIAAFFGSLASSGASVTGTVRVLPALMNPCIPITQDLAVTGTISSANLLTLKIPVAGGTAIITAQLSTTLQTQTAASYTIDGGSCAMATTAGSISQFAPLTGTYTGTLTESLPAGGQTATVTANLIQSSTPNLDGLFPLSGSVSVSGVCATTFSFTDGLITGNNVNGFYPLSYPPPPGVLRGAIIPTAALLQANLSLYIPACLNTYFGGTLTRQ